MQPRITRRQIEENTACYRLRDIFRKHVGKDKDLRHTVPKGFNKEQVETIVKEILEAVPTLNDHQIVTAFTTYDKPCSN